MGRKFRNYLLGGVCLIAAAGACVVWFETRPAVRRTHELIGVFEAFQQQLRAGDIEGMREMIQPESETDGPILSIEEGRVLGYGYDYTDALRRSEARFRASLTYNESAGRGGGKVVLTNGYVEFRDGKIVKTKIP